MFIHRLYCTLWDSLTQKAKFLVIIFLKNNIQEWELQFCNFHFLLRSPIIWIKIAPHYTLHMWCMCTGGCKSLRPKYVKKLNSTLLYTTLHNNIARKTHSIFWTKMQQSTCFHHGDKHKEKTKVSPTNLRRNPYSMLLTFLLFCFELEQA